MVYSCTNLQFNNMVKKNIILYSKDSIYID